MGFYFLFECHGEKINHKGHKEGAKDTKKLCEPCVNLCELCGYVF